MFENTDQSDTVRPAVGQDDMCIELYFALLLLRLLLLLCVCVCVCVCVFVCVCF